MFKLTVAFLALLSSIASATALVNRAGSPTPVPANTGIAQAPDAIVVLETCDGVNMGYPCAEWFSRTLPTDCAALRASGQDDTITSVKSTDGIQCTLYADKGCTGRSQLIVGTVNNLRAVGFDDTATSFQCSST